MAKFESIPLRCDEKQVGRFSLIREVHACDNKALAVEYGIFNNGEFVQGGNWVVEPKASADNPLDTLDKHWKQMKGEFEAMVEQANFYHFAKGGGDDDAEKIMRGFLSRVHSLLLLETPSEKNYRKGKVDEDDYPLVTLGERLFAMRETAQSKSTGLKLKVDNIEKMIHRMDKCLVKMKKKYDKATFDIAEDGLQGTAGDEPESESDWRGDVHKPGGKKQPWEDEDHDVDDARDLKADKLLGKFDKQAANFMEKVNRMWMKAFQRVIEGEVVQADPRKLEKLREKLADMEKTYGQLKELTQDTGVGAYEMKEFFAAIESEVLPQAHKLAAAMARPHMMEQEIKKGLPKNRDRE